MYFCKHGISAAWSITKTHFMPFKETVPRLKWGSYRLSQVFRQVYFHLKVSLGERIRTDVGFLKVFVNYRGTRGLPKKMQNSGLEIRKCKPSACWTQPLPSRVVYGNSFQSIFCVYVDIHNVSLSIPVTIAVALNTGGFVPRGHLGMSGDIFSGSNWARGEAMTFHTT